MSKIRGNTVGTTLKRALPRVTNGDEGKIVMVKGGEYTLESAETIVTADVSIVLTTDVEVEG